MAVTMEKNKSCPCKRVKCERRGDCAVCRGHHHAPERRSLTSCEHLRKKAERGAAVKQNEEG